MYIGGCCKMQILWSMFHIKNPIKNLYQDGLGGTTQTLDHIVVVHILIWDNTKSQINECSDLNAWSTYKGNVPSNFNQSQYKCQNHNTPLYWRCEGPASHVPMQPSNKHLRISYVHKVNNNRSTCYPCRTHLSHAL